MTMSKNILNDSELASNERSISYYGWAIVLASFTIQAIGYGNQYIIALLIQPLHEILRVPADVVVFWSSGGMNLFAGIASPLGGVLLQRYSTKTIVPIGIFIISVGYFLLAYSSNIFQVGSIFSIFFALGYVITTLGGPILISRWFTVRHGFAQGLAASGGAFTGFIVTPLATYAVAAFGVRVTCLYLAGAVLLSIPLVWKLIIDWPDAHYRSASNSKKAGFTGHLDGKLDRSGWTLQKLLRSPKFWVATTVGGIPSVLGPVVVTYLMLIADSAGISRQAASFLLSLCAGSSLIGMVALGAVYDSTTQRNTVRIPVVLLILGCSMMIGHPSYLEFAVGSIITGLGVGAFYPVPAVLLSASFGSEGFAVSLGAVSLFMVLFYTAFLKVFGTIYEHYGLFDYSVGYILLTLVFILVGTILLPSTRNSLVQIKG